MIAVAESSTTAMSYSARTMDIVQMMVDLDLDTDDEPEVDLPPRAKVGVDDGNNDATKKHLTLAAAVPCSGSEECSLILREPPPPPPAGTTTRRTTRCSVVTHPGVVLIRGPRYLSEEDDTSSCDDASSSHSEVVAALQPSSQSSSSPGSVTRDNYHDELIQATLVAEAEEDGNQLVEAKLLPIRTYQIFASIGCLFCLAFIVIGIATPFLFRNKSNRQTVDNKIKDIPPVTTYPTASPSRPPTMAPTIDYRQRLERYDHVVSYMAMMTSRTTDQCRLIDDTHGESSNWLVTASCQDQGAPTDLYLAGHHPLTKCHRVDDSTVSCRLKVVAPGFVSYHAIAFVCGAMGPELNSTALVVLDGLSLHNCTTRNMEVPAETLVEINTFCAAGAVDMPQSQCHASKFPNSQDEFCALNATNPCLITSRDNNASSSYAGCKNDDNSITTSDWLQVIKTIDNQNCSSPTWENNTLYQVVGLLMDAYG